jgi:peptidoglycan/xylan/chitin deacetylase (PgdA/CDA1 family)
LNKIAIVTTSWDDGHPCDLRLAEELAKRNLPGTFYVPITGEEHKPVLPAEVLRSFRCQGFEIGAHTVSHRILTGLPQKELWSEVRDSKQRLEELLGSEVRMFCYPRGQYDAEVIACVKQSGFAGARTTRMLAHAGKFEPFEMPTSLQVFPHPPLRYLMNLARHRDWAGAGRYAQKYLMCRSWVDLGKKLFDEVLRQGGVWHLYGHSWEIEELGLWGELLEMLEYFAHRPGVIYASNGEVLELMRKKTFGVLEAA